MHILLFHTGYINFNINVCFNCLLLMSQRRHETKHATTNKNIHLKKNCDYKRILPSNFLSNKLTSVKNTQQLNYCSDIPVNFKRKVVKVFPYPIRAIGRELLPVQSIGSMRATDHTADQVLSLVVCCCYFL